MHQWLIMCFKTYRPVHLIYFYAPAFRCRRHYVFGLSIPPSVRPKPFWRHFDLVKRVKFGGFGLSGERMEGMGWLFCMLMYLDHLQNWLVYSYGLLMFLFLALFWLSKTDQICGFRAFPGESIDGMAWHFVCWCLLTITRTDWFVAMVCWCFKFWQYLDLVKQVKFGGSGHFPVNT